MKKKKKKILLEEELYKNVPLKNLIVFGIYAIGQNGKKCTFESLVKRCFTLFPKAFAFPENPKWPDSRKLDRPLRTLRKRKLITGDPVTSFALTKKGEKLALDVAKSFRQRRLVL
jgi:hypothetical protein